MKIKTTTAFTALNARRAGERNAKMKFLVKKLNKDGSVSRSAFTEQDWRFNAFESVHDADARRIQLEDMNPGSTYIVVPA